MESIYIAEALYEKAEAHYLHKDYPETIHILKDALAQLEEYEPSVKGLILFLLAKSYFATTQYREARKIANTACKFFRNHQQSVEAARCNHLIGQIFSEQGRYIDAIKEFESGLALFPARLSGDSLKEKALLHLSLGQTAKEISKTDLQHTHFLRSLFIARRIQNRGLYAKSLLGLGVCFYYQRKLNFAQKILLKAIGHFHEIGDLEGIANSLHTLGLVYIHTFEYRKAVNAFKYSYTLFQHQEDNLYQASSLVHLGRIFLRIDPDTAEKVLRNVTDLLISQTSIHSQRQAEIILARYSVVMGLYYEKTGKIELARNLIKEGIDIFQKHHCEAEYKEALELYQAIKSLESPKKPKKNNILAFKLGIS